MFRHNVILSHVLAIFVCKLVETLQCFRADGRKQYCNVDAVKYHLFPALCGRQPRGKMIRPGGLQTTDIAACYRYKFL